MHLPFYQFSFFIEHWIMHPGNQYLYYFIVLPRLFQDQVEEKQVESLGRFWGRQKSAIHKGSLSYKGTEAEITWNGLARVGPTYTQGVSCQWRAQDWVFLVCSQKRISPESTGEPLQVWDRWTQTLLLEGFLAPMVYAQHWKKSNILMSAARNLMAVGLVLWNAACVVG